jgi:hypothetical protein
LGLDCLEHLFYYLYVEGFVSMIFECVDMQRKENHQEKIFPAEQEKTHETISPKDNIEELDLLPEFCHYADEGCRLAPSCLDCPFPACFEDQWRGESKGAKKMRDREIVRLYEVENLGTGELSARFNLDPRQIRRILAIRREKNERE